MPEVSTDDGIEREPSVQPSATVLPFIPTDVPNSSIGRSEPTSAALVGEGDADENPELTLVIPTSQYVPLNIVSAQGRTLSMGFYGAPQRPAPSILLLHDTQQDGDVWVNVAPQLQSAGYNVFTADLPGRRDDPSVVDWPAVVSEVENFATYIGNMTDIAAPTLTLAGIGTGADVALVACARLGNCLSVVAISPRNALPRLGISGLEFGVRRVLVMTADDDAAAVAAVEVLRAELGESMSWQRYTTGGRGIELFRTHPDATAFITTWLQGG